MLAFVALLTPATALGQGYTMKDLGALVPDGSSEATKINDQGQVVGWSTTASGKRHAFLWKAGATGGVSHNPQMMDLGTLGGDESVALGLADNPYATFVVGWSLTASGERHAFLWTAGGTDGVATNPQMRDLGTYSGTGYSEAVDLNDSGNEIVGTSSINAGDARAVKWNFYLGSTTPVITELGTLGGNSSSASGRNWGGQVGGYSQTATGGAIPRGFIWSSHTTPKMRDLGTLGGNSTVPYGMYRDAPVVIVGESATADGEAHAFMYTEDSSGTTILSTSMTDLGTLGGNRSRANATIGLLGVVGHSLLPDGSTRAFLWTYNGTDGIPSNPRMRDLGTLGGSYSTALGINTKKQVVGASLLPSGHVHAFLAVPGTPPSADAGVDISISVGQTVTLDGTASSDDNTGTAALAYAWTLTTRPAGSAAVLSGAATATPSFVADQPGAYVASLVVTDSDGLASAPDSVTISSTNLPPVANAGPSQVVVVGTTATLSGSAVDPEGNPVTFAWTLVSRPGGSAAQVGNAAAASASLSPDVAGAYVVKLVATDTFGSASEGSETTVTAITGQQRAQQLAGQAQNAIAALGAGSVTNGGNQNAIQNYIDQAIAALLAVPPDEATARQKLQQALERTDGCALRGSPDGNGAQRDWITVCADQLVVYELLVDALALLP